MPNHIQNRLEFSGSPEDIQQLLATIQGGEGDEFRNIDFDKILPCPKELDIESGSLGSTAFEALFDESQTDDITRLLYGSRDSRSLFMLDRILKMTIEDRVKHIEAGLKYYHNIKKYGYPTWYEWNRAHWGTKWNAYGQPDRRNTESTIYFQTAYRSPVELIRKMSEMFPGVTIMLTYADEDASSNTGIVSIANGQILTEEYPESGSNRGWELYFELHPGHEEWYEFKGGQWICKEE